MTPTLMHRIDARDRALFLRLALGPAAHASRFRMWRTLTHLGGARATIAACVVPIAFASVTLLPVVRALLLLGVSHLFVQIVKRFATRPRPSAAMSFRALVDVPDRFSFPSGHACAAMAVAIAWTSAFPAIGALLVTIAVLVGLSRVVLGVHYPGDVLAGQAIAIATAFLVLLVSGW